jgi:hypothetical protein
MSLSDILIANGIGAPFICGGQTLIPASGQITNPAPNSGLVLGQCTALPYAVPASTVLILDSMRLEGSGYGSGIELYEGTTNSTASEMDSLESSEAPAAQQKGQDWQASIQYMDLKWCFPPGAVINILLNDAMPGVITSWGMSGCLVPVASLPAGMASALSAQQTTQAVKPQ